MYPILEAAGYYRKVDSSGEFEKDEDGHHIWVHINKSTDEQVSGLQDILYTEDESAAVKKAKDDLAFFDWQHQGQMLTKEQALQRAVLVRDIKVEEQMAETAATRRRLGEVTAKLAVSNRLANDRVEWEAEEKRRKSLGKMPCDLAHVKNDPIRQAEKAAHKRKLEADAEEARAKKARGRTSAALLLGKLDNSLVADQRKH